MSAESQLQRVRFLYSSLDLFPLSNLFVSLFGLFVGEKKKTCAPPVANTGRWQQWHEHTAHLHLPFVSLSLFFSFFLFHLPIFPFNFVPGVREKYIFVFSSLFPRKEDDAKMKFNISLAAVKSLSSLSGRCPSGGRLDGRPHVKIVGADPLVSVTGT